MEDIEGAIEYYIDAVKIMKKSRKIISESVIINKHLSEYLNNISLSLGKIKQYEKAIGYSEEGISIKHIDRCRAYFIWFEAGKGLQMEIIAFEGKERM